MRSRWLSLTALLCLAWPTALSAQAPQAPDREVILLLEPGSLTLPPGTYEAELDRLPPGAARSGLLDGLRRAGIGRLERVIKRELKLPPAVEELVPAGPGLVDYDPHRLYRAVIPPGRSMQGILDHLNDVPGIIYAEPNGVIRQSAVAPTFPFAHPAPRSAFLLFPNDPEQNWGLYNPANRNSDVGAPEAWAIQTGIPSVRIAFLDTGGESGHFDLGSAKVVAGYDFVHDDPN